MELDPCAIANCESPMHEASEYSRAHRLDTFVIRDTACIARKSSGEEPMLHACERAAQNGAVSLERLETSHKCRPGLR